VSRKSNKKPGVGMTVQCEFDKVLAQPDICLACENPASENRIDYSIYNKFYTQKVIVKFPVCQACYDAKKQYVNLVPIFIVGAIVMALSIYSIFNQPNYINFSRTLFIVLGVIWLAILSGYLIYMYLYAKRNNTPDVVSRIKRLQTAVRAKKLVSPKRKRRGVVTLYFTNKKFARAFKKLNNGKYV
jgi:hypothetical protein